MFKQLKERLNYILITIIVLLMGLIRYQRKTIDKQKQENKKLDAINQFNENAERQKKYIQSKTDETIKQIKDDVKRGKRDYLDNDGL